MALNQSTSDEGQTQCHEDSIRAFQESNLNSKTLGEAPASPDEFLQHCGKKKKKEKEKKMMPFTWCVPLFSLCQDLLKGQPSSVWTSAGNQSIVLID